MSRMSWSARVIVGLALGATAGCAGRTSSEGGLGTGGAGASANAGVGGDHQKLGGSGGSAGTTHGGSSGTTHGGSSGTTHGGSSGTTHGGSSGTTHGGSSGGGGAPPNDCHGLGPLTQDPRCDACLLGPCCEATDGCFNDKPCLDLLQCVSNAQDCSSAPDEQRCYQERCGQFYSRDAIDRLNGFGTCYEETCGTACGSEPPSDCHGLGPLSQDPRCDACLLGPCCEATDGCLNDKGCYELLDCVSNASDCKGTPDAQRCYQERCGQFYSRDAIDRLNGFGSCYEDTCGADCGSEPNDCLQLSRSFGPPRCDQCLKGQCCDAIHTCIDQPGCDPLRECVVNNPGCDGTQYPEDCYRRQCGRLYSPAAMKAVNVLRECGFSSCDNECSGTEPSFCEPDLCPSNGRGAPCCAGPDGPCGYDLGNGCIPSWPPG